MAEAQEAQLKEIFDLFDTDGGGTIDRKEVSFSTTSSQWIQIIAESQRGVTGETFQLFHADGNRRKEVAINGRRRRLGE